MDADDDARLDPSAMTALGAQAERAGDDAAAWAWWRRAGFGGDEPAMRHLARALRRADPAEAQLWRWHAVVAGKRRAAGDPPADVTAAAAGLGPQRLAFGHGDRSPAEAGLGCGTLLVLAAAAAGLVAQLNGAVPVGITAFVLAGVGAAALVVSWLRVRGRRHPGVWEYADGLVVRTPDGRLAGARWAEITLDLATDPPLLGLPGGTLPLAPDAFPTGEQPVLLHRIGHHTDHPGDEPGPGVS
ncbi:hypothetical protein ACQEVB_19015 [Pseudonocardia sp. CA-107938]|uniref:hypothetical protein n=1 Tax=Pseudonocardia sp. CA-107938 TaxID=3240021 RepID=UPI003D8AC03C